MPRTQLGEFSNEKRYDPHVVLIFHPQNEPSVWEAWWKAEVQISNKMSDSMINIPAQVSFSNSVNRWMQEERRIIRTIIGGEFWLCPSSLLITRQVKDGAEPGTIFFFFTPFQKNSDIFFFLWEEKLKLSGYVNKNCCFVFIWSSFLCKRNLHFRKGVFFFLQGLRVRKSCESNSCCFLFFKQRPRTRWKLILHSGADVTKRQKEEKGNSSPYSRDSWLLWAKLLISGTIWKWSSGERKIASFVFFLSFFWGSSVKVPNKRGWKSAESDSNEQQDCVVVFPFQFTANKLKRWIIYLNSDCRICSVKHFFLND